MHELNSKINSVKNINWNVFKRLKNRYQDEYTFDVYNLHKFYLYSRLVVHVRLAHTRKITSTIVKGIKVLVLRSFQKALKI